MKEALFDTPIFLTFFIRHYTLEKVFEVISEIRPRILFLVGDGPRIDCAEDEAKIDQCKRILENIDWDCKVYRFYSEKNRGILTNTNEGLKNAFNIVDRIICLEDDKVPSKSFFYFCQEMLEKYENDLRIQAICGINVLGKYLEPKSDYFFARFPTSGAIAYWKRTFMECDFSNPYLEDTYVVKNIKLGVPKGLRKNFISRAILERKEYLDKPEPKSIELFRNINEVINSQLNIIPSRNLVKMIGITPDSAHSLENIRMVVKPVREVHELDAMDMDFPLKHPKYIIRDINYENILRRKMAVGHPCILFYRRIITLLLVIRFSGIRKGIKLLMKKIKELNIKKTHING